MPEEPDMPYELLVSDHVSAAHNLRQYKGKCEHLHGHNWRVDLRLAGDDLDDEGMLVDFVVVKRILAEALEDLDHAYLNDVPPFDEINPSSENLARVIAERVASRLPEGVRLTSVTTWESERCAVTYRPEEAGGA
jgi:6-pyruvoyltetrahydropterin/6-carboxytetrahydropterin synthase